MDLSQIAKLFADEMVSHRQKLAGKAGEAQAAQAALESAAKAMREQHDAQAKAARAVLSEWDAKSSASFEAGAAKFGDNLGTTAEASRRGAKIVSEVTDALAARHDYGGGLVEEFVTKASSLVRAGAGLAGIAVPGALLKAVGEVADLAGGYLKESGDNLSQARAEMEDAARKLRALESELNADGVADPAKPGRQPARTGKGTDSGKDTGGEKKKHSSNGAPQAGSGKVEKILDHARDNLGYHEGPNNRNKWGPTGQPWCAYFATSMWRDAGVNIPTYGRVADAYSWGEHHGTAYDRGDIAGQARPGDMIMFGSDKQHPEHVGLIEKVDGNKITTIEGNADDQVERITYTLPRDAKRFYGGVHPK
jgi:CHAP domain-containing protein